MTALFKIHLELAKWDTYRNWSQTWVLILCVSLILCTSNLTNASEVWLC